MSRALKALSKARDRRYQSARELARDIDHYLTGAPIEARRDSGWYGLKKTLQRHRVPVAVAGSFAVVVVVALVVSLTFWRQATVDRDLAGVAKKEAVLSLAAEAAARKAEAAERAKAEKLADDTRGLLSRQYVGNGVRLMDDGDLMGSLVWFAEALKLDQGDTEREEMHRIRLATVLRQCPKLTRMQFYKYENGERFVAFSADGRRIVTVGSNAARVWDAATGEPVTPPLNHGAYMHHASFSPDGRQVVTASRDKTARVWDAATGQPVTPPLRHGEGVHHASFSPDGRRVVTASGDRTARVWDATTGEPITPPLMHCAPLWHASFSPDGRRIVTASDDKSARVWDATTGEPALPPLNLHNRVRYASFSPNGRRVVTASLDKTARVWDATIGKPVTPPLKHGEEMRHASFSPDGRRVVTASLDNTARVWDAGTGEPVTPPLKHGDVVYDASFSPDGRRVVTASSDNAAQVWDVSPDERPVDDLVLLAQLLASQRIDPTGALETIDTETLHVIWDTLRSKYPSQFIASPEEIDAWYQREADSIVDALFEELALIVDVVEHLRTNETLSDRVREVALRLAVAHKEDPVQLNRESWRVVKAPDGTADAYDLALRKAQAACKIAPDKGVYLNTLGVAQYRVGD